MIKYIQTNIKGDHTKDIKKLIQYEDGLFFSFPSMKSYCLLSFREASTWVVQVYVKFPTRSNRRLKKYVSKWPFNQILIGFFPFLISLIWLSFIPIMHRKLKLSFRNHFSIFFLNFSKDQCPWPLSKRPKFQHDQQASSPSLYLLYA